MRKKRDQRGEKWRSELVRKRNAILSLGLGEERRERERGEEEEEEARVKRVRSETSSERGMGGGRGMRGGRMRGASRKKRSGRVRIRENERTYGDDSIIIRAIFEKMGRLRLGLGFERDEIESRRTVESDREERVETMGGGRVNCLCL